MAGFTLEIILFSVKTIFNLGVFVVLKQPLSMVVPEKKVRFFEEKKAVLRVFSIPLSLRTLEMPALLPPVCLPVFSPSHV